MMVASDPRNERVRQAGPGLSSCTIGLLEIEMFCPVKESTRLKYRFNRNSIRSRVAQMYGPEIIGICYVFLIS